MFHFPTKRVISDIEQFGLKIIDFANLVQALGGNRNAVRSAEKQIGGNLYMFWPGTGIDYATEDWNVYVTWLYEIKDLIIEDISLTERVLLSRGFRLAPTVW